jgi:hypothetical protein
MLAERSSTPTIGRIITAGEMGLVERRAGAARECVPAIPLEREQRIEER